MAFGAIEFTTISRAQDYTTIKHNEDSKGFVDQTNIGQQMNKNVEQLTKEVHQGDSTGWQNKKFDAKEKGSNSYDSDGGKKRKQDGKPKEQMVAKEYRGFDIKI